MTLTLGGFGSLFDKFNDKLVKLRGDEVEFKLRVNNSDFDVIFFNFIKNLINSTLNWFLVSFNQRATLLCFLFKF